MNNARRYSVLTWDGEEQAYTPQAGTVTPWHNITLRQLRAHLRELRRMGYSAHRKRDDDGGHDDNDWHVLVADTTNWTAGEVLAMGER